MAKGTVLLAAGGTGGHLFPAEALAHELIARGWTVHLATDGRAERFAGGFPAAAVHSIASATIGSRNPLALAGAFWTIWRGVRQASALIRKLEPAAVVGFGGYPTLPPRLRRDAAQGADIDPRAECRDGTRQQGAGRTRGCDRRRLPGRRQRRRRGEDRRHGKSGPAGGAGGGGDALCSRRGGRAFPAPGVRRQPGRTVLLARPFRRRSPCLPEDRRGRLRVTQQARAEDVEQVRKAYEELGVPAEVSPFFSDMARRIAGAHLVMSRSGASTVSEIAVIGRPALFVPYPHALDHDQAANAAALAAAGGAEVHPQASLSAERIAELIGGLMDDPDRLARMAAAAKSAGRPDAARLLADLTEAIAQGTTISEFKKGARP